MKKIRLCSVLISFLATIDASAALLVAENFGGDSEDNLSTTQADTFAAGIVTAGGSSAWTAAGVFKADGSITSNGSDSDGAAFLNMGTYINDTKGTEAGFFTLQATVTQPTSGGSSPWISFGMFNGGILTGEAFFTTSDGLATSVLRESDSGGGDYFGGPGATNSNGSGLVVSGLTTFTTTLDFTTAGGYNGSTNFGTAKFYRNGGSDPEFSYTYTTNLSFNQVGFSINDSANSTISNFTVSQVPEAGTITMLLGAIGLLVLFGRRRA